MRLVYIFLLSLFPASAMSATIVEGIDYADASPAMIGPLDAGTHTISGSLSGDCLGTVTFSCLFGSDPQDILEVSFASGTQLQGLSFQLSNSLPSAASFAMGFTYSSSEESFTFSGLLAGSYAPLGITPVRDPITLIFTGDTALPNVASYTANWSVTLDVAAVPLPGGLGLLAGSLMCFAIARRNTARRLDKQRM